MMMRSAGELDIQKGVLTVPERNALIVPKYGAKQVEWNIANTQEQRGPIRVRLLVEMIDSALTSIRSAK